MILMDCTKVDEEIGKENFLELFDLDGGKDTVLATTEGGELKAQNTAKIRKEEKKKDL